MSDETRPIPTPDEEPGAAEDHPTRPIQDLEHAERRRDAGGGGSRWQFGGRDMHAAIVSGVLLVVGLFATLAWHPFAFTTFILVLILLAIFEGARVISGAGHPVAVPVLVAAAVVMMLAAYRAASAGQAVGVAVLFVGAIVWQLSDGERREVFREAATTCLVGLWVPFLASYSVLLVNRPQDGWVAVIATIGVAVFSDIGAFAVGTKFGRRKLAPSISPGKTWEGVTGGLAIAVVLAAVILPVLGSGELFDPTSAMVFAFLVGTAGAVGDLAESMLKRDLGVKDLGGLIPGHGGVLDRADSLLFALPTGYYVLAAIGS